MTTNIFQKYTLAIANDYEQTAAKIAEAQKTPPKRAYNDMRCLLQECVLLGATRYGTNFVC